EEEEEEQELRCGGKQLGAPPVGTVLAPPQSCTPAPASARQEEKEEQEEE
ncbi:unnamed protein product, partial [Prorocentrum cordatum]